MIKRKPKNEGSETLVESSVEEMPIPTKVRAEKPEVKKEPETLGSKEVKVDPDKKDDDSVMVDYMSESFSDKEASKRTKENTDESIPNKTFDKPIDEIKKEVGEAEAKRSQGSMSGQEILRIATFMVNAFNGGIGILLNFIARDNRVSVYTLPAETKRELSEQLALILIKYQVKFKIEFMFLLTIIIAYIGPVGGALKHRKQIHNDNAPKKVKGGQAKPKQELIEEKEEEEEMKKDEPLIQEAPPEKKTLKIKPPRRSSVKKANI